MELQISEVSGVTKAVLEGRLDTMGVGEVETRFVTQIAPSEQSAIVDLSGVSFIASLGIRMLLTTARSLAHQGKKLAMFGVQPDVLEIIETTAISDIIPVVPTEAEALAVVTA